MSKLDLLPRCGCGRFVGSPTKDRPLGWYAHGEFGEETGYKCSSCVKSWTPRDGRGRGPEAGFCGILTEPTLPLRTGHDE